MPENGSYPTKEEIQAAAQASLAHEDVFVEAWGITVPVCELLREEHDSYQSVLYKARSEIKGARRQKDAEITTHLEMHAEKACVRLCWLAMKNPHTGKRIFDSEAEVGRLPKRGLDPIWEAAQRVNGMDEEALEAEGKGSAPNQSDTSPSPSAGI